MRFYFSDMSRARRAIKTGWIAGLVYSLLGTLAIFSRLSLDPTDITSVLMVALLFGLTFGVYQKRSTAALVLFFLGITNVLTQLVIFFLAISNPFTRREDATIQLIVTLVLLLPFVYCFWEGMRGVLSFHRLQRAT